MNETLCRALLQARLTEEDVAARLQVDPKTVRRWLEGRVPYLRHRWALAALLGLDETDLWPHLRRTRSRPDEVQAIYPHLDAVPEEAWLRLFRSAEREIGILTETAQPITGHPRVLQVLVEKAMRLHRMRICLFGPAAQIPGTLCADKQGCSGPPNGGTCEAMARLASRGAVQIRLLEATLFQSLFFGDDHILVSQRIYGTGPDESPVIWLNKSQHGKHLCDLYGDV